MLGVCRQHLYNDAKHLIRQISSAMATQHRGQKTMLCTPWQHDGGRRPEDRATGLLLVYKEDRQKDWNKASTGQSAVIRIARGWRCVFWAADHTLCSRHWDYMHNIHCLQNMTVKSVNEVEEILTCFENTTCGQTHTVQSTFTSVVWILQSCAFTGSTRTFY